MTFLYWFIAIYFMSVITVLSIIDELLKTSKLSDGEKEVGRWAAPWVPVINFMITVIWGFHKLMCIYERWEERKHQRKEARRLKKHEERSHRFMLMSDEEREAEIVKINAKEPGTIIKELDWDKVDETEE
jgi:hypothetical protein